MGFVPFNKFDKVPGVGEAELLGVFKGGFGGGEGC